jgi:Flp pilus assembly protein TadD
MATKKPKKIPGKQREQPGPKTRNPSRHDRYIVPGICFVLVAAIGIIYGQTLHFEFINYDDGDLVYKNDTVQGPLTLASIFHLFTDRQVYDQTYPTPLPTLSLMLDHKIYGSVPGGYHLTNVLLHTATSIFLFLALRKMTSALWPSAFAAAVFALHPLRVESVAWVAERKDILSGLFFVLTIGAYARYAGKPWHWRNYLPIPVLFALGLMSKPMLVTLPAVLLLLDYWPLRRFRNPDNGRFSIPRRLILEKIPLLCLSAVSCIITLVFMIKSMPAKPIPVSFQISNAIASIAIYVKQFFYPVNLAAFYPLPMSGYDSWHITFLLLLLAAISAAAWLMAKKCPALLVGWVWFLVMLLPVLGLVQSGGQAHADRFTYLPEIGLCLALAWGCENIFPPKLFPALSITAMASLAILFRLSYMQTGYWHDSSSLWGHTLACTQKNAVAENNLASFLISKGNYDDAITHSQKAIAIDPSFEEAQENLGLAFSSEGRFDEAIIHYREAVKLKPDYADAYNNLGMACLQTGRLDDAIMAFRSAVDSRPRHLSDEATFNSNLGAALMLKGNTEAAIAPLQRAADLEPDSIGFQANLAWLMATSPQASIRNGGKAVELAEHAAKISGGNDPKILNILGAAYAEAGRYPDAIKAASAALQLAGQQTNSPLASLVQREISLYEAGEPYRDVQPLQ